MEPNKVLEVCFLIDCTGSMQKWIAAVKDKAITILNNVNIQHPTWDIALAFVGYRDLKDEVPFIICDFTYDHQSIITNIRDLKAEGGDDECEDVAGAYKTVNSLEWSGDKRILIHITDAPAHGSQYHVSYISDWYPDGTPDVDFGEEVHKLTLKNIELTFVRIVRDTDLMTNFIEDVYGEAKKKFDILNLNRHSNTQEFERVLSHHISNSITHDPDMPY